MRVEVRLLQLHDLVYLTIIIMQNSTQAQMLLKGSYYHSVTDLIYCAKKFLNFIHIWFIIGEKKYYQAENLKNVLKIFSSINVFIYGLCPIIGFYMQRVCSV